MADFSFGSVADLSAIIAAILLIVPLNAVRKLAKQYSVAKKEEKAQGLTKLEALEARLQFIEDGVFSINFGFVVPAAFLLIIALICWFVDLCT